MWCSGVEIILQELQGNTRRHALPPQESRYQTVVNRTASKAGANERNGGEDTAKSSCSGSIKLTVKMPKGGLIRSFSLREERGAELSKHDTLFRFHIESLQRDEITDLPPVISAFTLNRGLCKSVQTVPSPGGMTSGEVNRSIWFLSV